MPEDKLKFLGDRIRSARKDCGLTQQALADQADLAVKTIQDVERGRKNTTYETLCQLIERLGISPNSLFPSQMSPEDEAIQHFIGKFRACKPRYGDYHIPGQRKNNGKDAGIPGLRRLSHFGCDCGNLAVDIAKHTRQIASDGPD